MDENSKKILYSQLLEMESENKNSEKIISEEEFIQLPDKEALVYVLSYRERADFGENVTYYISLPDMDFAGQDLSDIYLNEFIPGVLDENNNLISSKINFENTNITINLSDIGYNKTRINENGMEDYIIDFDEIHLKGCRLYGFLPDEYTDDSKQSKIKSKILVEHKENLDERYLDRRKTRHLSDAKKKVTDKAYDRIMSGKSLYGLSGIHVHGVDFADYDFHKLTELGLLIKSCSSYRYSVDITFADISCIDELAMTLSYYELTSIPIGTYRDPKLMEILRKRTEIGSLDEPLSHVYYIECYPELMEILRKRIETEPFNELVSHMYDIKRYPELMEILRKRVIAEPEAVSYDELRRIVMSTRDPELMEISRKRTETEPLNKLWSYMYYINQYPELMEILRKRVIAEPEAVPYDKLREIPMSTRDPELMEILRKRTETEPLIKLWSHKYYFNQYPELMEILKKRAEIVPCDELKKIAISTRNPELMEILKKRVIAEPKTAPYDELKKIAISTRDPKLMEELRKRAETVTYDELARIAISTRDPELMEILKKRAEIVPYYELTKIAISTRDPELMEILKKRVIAEPKTAPYDELKKIAISTRDPRLMEELRKRAETVTYNELKNIAILTRDPKLILKLVEEEKKQTRIIQKREKSCSGETLYAQLLKEPIDEQLIYMLIEAGSDVNYVNVDESHHNWRRKSQFIHTPIFIAALKIKDPQIRDRVLKKLIENGVDLDNTQLVVQRFKEYSMETTVYSLKKNSDLLSRILNSAGNSEKTLETNEGEYQPELFEVAEVSEESISNENMEITVNEINEFLENEIGLNDGAIIEMESHFQLYGKSIYNSSVERLRLQKEILNSVNCSKESFRNSYEVLFYAPEVLYARLQFFIEHQIEIDPAQIERTIGMKNKDFEAQFGTLLSSKDDSISIQERLLAQYPMPNRYEELYQVLKNIRNKEMEGR